MLGKPADVLLGLPQTSLQRGGGGNKGIPLTRDTIEVVRGIQSALKQQIMQVLASAEQKLG